MNTLSFSHLGRMGRLGNMLHQIAATIGLALKHELTPVFPPWAYDRYFVNPIPHGEMNTNRISEEGFLYKDIPVQSGHDLVGYLQSEKYWIENKQAILDQFTFTETFKDYFRNKRTFGPILEKETVAIHIRRGDYVNNPNYYNLPIDYYTGAIAKYFPDIKDKNILVFSDDIAWAKEHFPMADNVKFVSDQSDIDDLCLMSLCTHFIIANSSFSWWGAYLGSQGKSNAIVVRPAQYFEWDMKLTHDISDLYPESWKVYDHISSTDQQSREINITTDIIGSKLFQEALQEKGYAVLAENKDVVVDKVNESPKPKKKATPKKKK